MAILTYQPFKALYTLLAVFFEAARFPLWFVFFIPQGGRPHPKWTHAQALRMKIVKAFLVHSSAVQVKTPLSLEPGKEGNRFVVMEPAPSKLYKEPTVDTQIKPQKIGGTWTPKAYSSSVENADTVDVVLHLHGGAYVIGNGRDSDTGFLAKTMLKHGKVTHVFTPQYRLSSNPGGRFPAALQDAITSYHYLLNTLKIPASRITISGDSAGGNLALGLLRYISVHGEEVGLPWPGCVWLWSPWVDVEATRDKKNMIQSPRYATDYLGPGFGKWGLVTFCPAGSGIDSKSPWLSPLNHAFASKSPIFVQTGDAEILYDDNVTIAGQFKDIAGNKVELLVKEGMPHDIILTGPLVGFTKEAADSAQKAGEFLRAERAKL